MSIIGVIVKAADLTVAALQVGDKVITALKRVFKKAKKPTTPPRAWTYENVRHVEAQKKSAARKFP